MTDNLKTWPERIWLGHGEDMPPEYTLEHFRKSPWLDFRSNNCIEYIRADLVKPMCVCGNPSDHEKYVHRVDGPCYARAVDQQELAHTDHPIRHYDRTCPACTRTVRTSPPIWERGDEHDG